MLTDRLAGVGLIVGLALASAGVAEAQINIGIVGPLTGPSAVFGMQFKNGASQAIDDINNTAGILNRKIVPHYGDDIADVGQGVVVANSFVQDHVRYVVGHFNSAVTLRASRIYQSNDILEITPSATNVEITERGMWNVFRTCGRDDQQGEVAGTYIVQHFGGKRIAIVHNKSPYGKGLADQTKSTINANGIKEVLYDTIDDGQTEFSNLILKLRAYDVSLIYVAAEHTEAALLLKQMRNSGVQSTMMGGDGLSTIDFGVIAGDAAIGTLMTFSPDPRKRPEAKTVVERFRAKRFEPEAYTLYSYAAVQIIKQAAELAKSLEPKDLARQLVSGAKFKTVIGEISYDKKGDITRFDYVMYVWKRDPGGNITYTEVR